MRVEKKFSIAQNGRAIIDGLERTEKPGMVPVLEIFQGGDNINITKIEAKVLAAHLEMWAEKEWCPTCGREKE